MGSLKASPALAVIAFLALPFALPAKPATASDGKPEDQILQREQNRRAASVKGDVASGRNPSPGGRESF